MINRARLPRNLEQAVATAISEWDSSAKMKRLWDRDASVWTGADEARWLDWLGIVDQQRANLAEFSALSAEVRAGGYSDLVLLGMGGSSLCPEVLKLTFGRQPGFPEMHVLDSTDPAQIRALEGRIDLGRSLFIVSSKSGSTLEPNIFMEYFYGRAADGKRFFTVTDPGSNMQKEAERRGFAKILAGVPGIGGRYSALSNFGMVPAAAAGLDVPRLLEGAYRMKQACGPSTPAMDNPGLVLGAIMGCAANAGRGKLTLIVSPGIHDLGAWLEQLVAESTGKNGKGIIPVDREPLGPPEVYGGDRLFAYIRLTPAPDAAQDLAVEALENAGQAVVRIEVGDIYDLGGEFFRWEIATAVAGAILGINPFDQPDVEASKIATKSLTSQFENTGSFPPEQGVAGFSLPAAGSDWKSVLRGHLNTLQPGDYFAVLAYLEMNAAHENTIQRFRTAVRDTRGVATCLGFGPRFLHSTGQGYKGGPNTGVFLQITCDDAADLAIPGRKYTFGVVKQAQARGDLQVLIERKRRALRVHLSGDVDKGLQELGAGVVEALGAA